MTSIEIEADAKTISEALFEAPSPNSWTPRSKLEEELEEEALWSKFADKGNQDEDSQRQQSSESNMTCNSSAFHHSEKSIRIDRQFSRKNFQWAWTLINRPTEDLKDSMRPITNRLNKAQRDQMFTVYERKDIPTQVNVTNIFLNNVSESSGSAGELPQ